MQDPEQGPRLIIPTEDPPRVALVMRSFLDYRVPVFAELSKLLNGRLWVLYSRQHTPDRVRNKLDAALGDNAIGFDGERVLGYKGNITGELPNSTWRIPFQPGIVKRLRELAPDIVVGDGFFQWTWQALVYRIFANKSLVICYERTAHTEKNAQWYRVLFRKFVLKFCSAMAVNGKLTREYVESLGMKPLLVKEGQMVADTSTLAKATSELSESDQIELRSKFTRSQDSRVYLSVSRLIQLKGVAELLTGWREYKLESGHNDVLIIIGNGPEKENLETQCESLGITGVHFLGNVDYDSIHHYYAMADWFVIPSLVDNWSLVVPEAMACGLPILCSKYNGCWPELVHEGVNGWVFDPLVLNDIVRVLKLSSQTINRPEMAIASGKLIADHTPGTAALAIYRACRIAIKE